MNFFNITLITLLFSSLSFYASAEEKMRVLDKGMDGSKRYYYVTCPDGSRNSVVAKYSMPDGERPEAGEDDLIYSPPAEIKLIEICMSSEKGLYECRANWSVDEAAEASCT